MSAQLFAGRLFSSTLAQRWAILLASGSSGPETSEKVHERDIWLEGRAGARCFHDDQFYRKDRDWPRRRADDGLIESHAAGIRLYRRQFLLAVRSWRRGRRLPCESFRDQIAG